MKRSKIRLLFTVIVTLVTLLIAVPTITFTLGDENKRIRGINPEDLNSSFITSEFGFRPSLDFQEGYATEFNVQLDVLPVRDRSATLNRIRNIIYRRLQLSGIADFELDSLENHETGEYKLVLKSSEQINILLLDLLVQRGELSAWIDDPTVDTAEATEEDLQDPFFTRQQTGITNDDIESASVVSDSRIFLFDPSTPQNYGIRLVYRPESTNSYVNAAQQSVGSTSPILYAIDSNPIAFQTPGQIYDPLNPGRTSLLVTLNEDTRQTNAIIASVMGTPTINFPVSLLDQQVLQSRYGGVTVSVLQIGSVVGFVLLQLAFWVFFRKQALFSLVMQSLFAVWGLALMKMFTLTLSLGTLLGFLSGFSMFMIFMGFLLVRLRDFASDGYSKDELAQVHSETVKSFRNFSIVLLLIILISQSFGIVPVLHYTNGLGFAIVSGILVVLIALPGVLPEFYLRKTKKRS